MVHPIQPGHAVEHRSLLREVNDRIAAVAWAIDEEESLFICECGDEFCTRQVSLSIAQYWPLRSDNGVLAPGHTRTMGA